MSCHINGTKMTKNISTIAMCLILGACQNADSLQPESDKNGGSLVGPEWVVEDINNQGIIDSSRISLEFTDEGRVQGFAGCNRFNGSYELTEDGLRIGQLAQTRMACAAAIMEQEDQVLTTLQSVTSFRIDDTGALRLSGGSEYSLKAYEN